ELLPDDVRSWLTRALQSDADQSFASAIEARDAFASVLTGVSPIGGPSEPFKAFMKTHEKDAAAAPETLIRWPASPVVEAGSQRSRPTAVEDVPVGRVLSDPAVPEREETAEAAAPRHFAFGRSRVIAAAVVHVLF